MTTAPAQGTPMRPAADPPMRVDAVVANASLLEMDESGAENADTPNGVSVAIVKTERRTMVHFMDVTEVSV